MTTRRALWTLALAALAAGFGYAMTTSVGGDVTTTQAGEYLLIGAIVLAAVGIFHLIKNLIRSALDPR